MPRHRPDRVLRDVGRRIAELRATRGWTQEGLAERLQVGAKYVQAVERGQENLTLITLAKIAEELDVSIAALTRRPLRAAPRAGRPSKHANTLPFTEIEPAPHDLYRRCVPLVTLEARAGKRDQARAVETSSWVVPRTHRRLASGMFVARIVGDSMAPAIPEGSWGLFRAVSQTPAAGVVVLAQHRTDDDPEDAGTFVLKRLERGARRGLRLVSANAAYHPIPIDLGSGRWRLVAVLVETLRVE